MKMPKYTQHFIDRHGTSRFYFRKAGSKQVPLPGLPWSPQFMAAYESAMAGQGELPTIVNKRAKQGSFAALAASYFTSTAFLTMKPSSKGVYRNAIDRLPIHRQGRQRDRNQGRGDLAT
jgi:hypothetical protein